MQRIVIPSEMTVFFIRYSRRLYSFITIQYFITFIIRITNITRITDITRITRIFYSWY